MNDLFDIATAMTEQFIEQFCFNDFWETYGKIGNKKQAEKSYNKAIKRASHEEIIRGVTEYKAQCRSRKTERKHIKHGSTWLNNDGWQDEYIIEPNKLERTQNAAVRGHIRAENPDF